MNKLAKLVCPILAMLATRALAQQWNTSYGGTNNSLLQISYGISSSQPEYAVIDLTSAYLRLNYGPASGWGTSIDVMPSYWSGGSLYQGYAVTASTKTSGGNLVVTLSGTSNALRTTATLAIHPPANNRIVAQVAALTSGIVTLDNRPGEAFKPVFLSSMHDSNTVWDSNYPYVGKAAGSYPSSDWIVAPTPMAENTNFGLIGGTSTWKTNAPTVKIIFSIPMQVAGWMTSDSSPNDDNVGFWCATSKVLKSWSYQIEVSNATS